MRLRRGCNQGGLAADMQAVGPLYKLSAHCSKRGQQTTSVDGPVGAAPFPRRWFTTDGPALALIPHASSECLLLRRDTAVVCRCMCAPTHMAGRAAAVPPPSRPCANVPVVVLQVPVGVL